MPTLGTLQNQLFTLPCIFKPKFLPPKHKRPQTCLYCHYLLHSNKIFVFGQEIKFKHLSILAVFLFSYLSQVHSALLIWDSPALSSITDHFPLLKLFCPLFVGPSPPLQGSIPYSHRSPSGNPVSTEDLHMRCPVQASHRSANESPYPAV